MPLWLSRNLRTTVLVGLIRLTGSICSLACRVAAEVGSPREEGDRNDDHENDSDEFGVVAVEEAEWSRHVQSIGEVARGRSIVEIQELGRSDWPLRRPYART